MPIPMAIRGGAIGISASVGGSTIIGGGDWLLEFALPLYVLVDTESGLSTAAVYLIGLVVGLVLGPIGGALADRNIRETCR